MGDAEAREAHVFAVVATHVLQEVLKYIHGNHVPAAGGGMEGDPYMNNSI